MYCKAITKKGYPCTHRANGYCGNHTPKGGEYEECAVCYDDLQSKTILMCGHSFCLPCLQRLNTSICPMCRRNTNTIYKTVKEKVKEIHRALREMPNIIGLDNRKAQARHIFSTVMSIHSYLFSADHFLEQFEQKMMECSRDGMDTDLYNKQLAAFYYKRNKK